MKNYNPGDIVLLSFPFVDGTGVKRRPAMVLLDTEDDDIIVSRVTSNLFQSRFDVNIIEWQQAGLLLPSVVRLHKVATLEKNLVEKKLGSVVGSDWEIVRSTIQRL